MLRYFGTALIAAVLATAEDQLESLSEASGGRYLQDSEQASVIQVKNLAATNANNMYFFTTLYVGSNRQQMRFLLDTGSSHMWVPDKSCDGCKTFPRFDKDKSTTWVEESEAGKALQQPQGLVYGQLGQDQVSFGDSNSMDESAVNQMNVLSVTKMDRGSYADGYLSDGVIGLNRLATDDQSPITFVQQLYDEQQIPKNMFSLQLKDDRNPGQSRFWLGGYDYKALRNFRNGDRDLRDNQLDQLIQWSPIDQSERYWAFQPNKIRMIMGPTKQVVASTEQFQRTLVQLNTASAFIYMPAAQYESIKRYIEDILKIKCRFPGPDVENQPSLVCMCNPSNLEVWPVIEFQLGGENGQYFPHKAKDYLIYNSQSTTVTQECTVKLRPLSETQEQNRWLLGNSFLRNYISIYDNSNNTARVGLFGGSQTPEDTIKTTTYTNNQRRYRFNGARQTWVLIPFIVVILLVCICIIVVMLILESTRQQARNEKRIIPVEKNGKRQQANTEMICMDERATLTVIDGHKPYTGPYPPASCGHSPGRRHIPQGRLSVHEEKMMIIDRSKLKKKDFEGDIESLRARIFENGQLSRQEHCQEHTLPVIGSAYDRSLNDREFDRSLTQVPMDTGKGATLLAPSKGDKQFYHSLKSKVEKEAGERYTQFEAIGFMAELVRDEGQNVIGTLYRVKYCTGGDAHIHVRIFQPLATDTLSSPTLALHGESPMPAIVQAVQTNHTHESPFTQGF